MYDVDKKHNGIRNLEIDIHDMDVMKKIIHKYFNNFLNNEKIIKAKI